MTLAKIGRLFIAVLAGAGLLFGATACSGGTSKDDQEVAVNELLGRGFETAQFEMDVEGQNGKDGYARYRVSIANCGVDIRRTADGSMFYENQDIYKLNLEEYLGEPKMLELQGSFYNSYALAMKACE